MAKKNRPDNREPEQPLRQRAEELLRMRGTDIAKMSAENLQAVFHELQVHQIELELQNQELREAQLKLAESCDRYSDLYEFAPVGYLTLDVKGQIIEANLAAATLLGVERKDLVGAGITRFVARESQDNFYFYLQNVFSSDTKQITELTMHRKDGALLEVQLESIYRPVPTAATYQCRTALIDVTDLRNAQQKLQQLNEELEQRVSARTADLRFRTDQLAWQSAELERREREFRTLANNVPAMFSYIDRNQRYSYVNHRYEEMFQRPASDIVGKTVEQLVGSAHYEHVRPHVETVLQGEEVAYQTDFDFVDGQHSMHVNFVPDLDEKGQVQGFFVLATDITALKRAEQQLKLLAHAVANLGEGVMITSDDLDWPGPRIVFVNEAMCRISGYTAEELIGKTPRILQGNTTNRAVLERLKSELAAGRSFLCELVNYRKDRTPYDAELFITPLYDAEGRRTNFVSVHRDITERKELERQVVRTASEEQRRLGQELHDDVGQEMTGLALTADTFLTILSRKAMPEADMAAKLAEDINRTADKIRNLSRGLIPVQVAAGGLATALGKLAERLSDLDGRTCKFICDSPVSIESTETATHLYNIAQEASNNAIKHGTASHIQIQLEEEDAIITLRIRDNGTGIDPAKAAESPGMGLRIMRHRASLIDGVFTIEPAERGGTLVTCTVRQ